MSTPNNLPAEFATIRAALKMCLQFFGHEFSCNTFGRGLCDCRRSTLQGSLAALDALAAREVEVALRLSWAEATISYFRNERDEALALLAKENRMSTPPAPPAAECAVRSHEWMEWLHSGKGVPWRVNTSEFNALLDAGWEIVAIENSFTLLHRAALATPCQHGEAQSEIARLRADKAEALQSCDTYGKRLLAATAELAQARKSTEEAQAQLVALAEVRDLQMSRIRAELRRAVDALRKAAYELNTIRARDGVPWTGVPMPMRTDVVEEYFSSVVDECHTVIAAYDAKHGDAK